MKFQAKMSSTSVIATRTGTCESHCHDLESLDRQKKNSGIMALAASQVSQGHNVAAVAANLTVKAGPQDRVLLKELGGHWINLKDVHNSATAYKAKEAGDTGPAERSLAVREICDSLFQQYCSMEEASAGWENGVRKRFPEHWIGQLRVMAGKVCQAGSDDMVRGKETRPESSQRTEGQALTKEQWLQYESSQWDLREAMKQHAAKEDSQPRKEQLKPPGSRKRRRNGDEVDNGTFPPSEKDTEGHSDALLRARQSDC